MERLESWEEFEAVLQRPGPWVAGLDFPFGQPRELVENLGWPLSWEKYVECVARMTREEYAAAIKVFRDGRPCGMKHLYRGSDRLARACSPMMLYGVPVGKMFYEGAPRLLRSGASVIPCRPNGSSRVAVEAYPGVLARRWIQRRSYKSETRQNRPWRGCGRGEI